MDTTVEVYTAFMDHLQDMEDTDMEDNNTEDTMATTSFSFVEIVVLHFKTTNFELHLRIVHFTFVHFTYFSNITAKVSFKTPSCICKHCCSLYALKKSFPDLNF